MASLSGVSGSNTVSSLMNSANMISGLASGLDTEGMIENLVKSYQTKISQLNQKVTKTEWKQDAYRSIISKLAGFSSKYTSYTSNTNLMSPSFFSGAVKVLTKGEFADSVTASGKTGSDISLDAVHQLAKAAQYRTKMNLDPDAASAAGTISGKAMDLSADADKNIELSNLSGSLTLTYGSKTVSVSFNEATDVDAMKDIREKLSKDQGIAAENVNDTDVLAELINQKLADQKIVFNNGNAESADKRIKAIANADGRIVFEEQGTGKNGVYISGASGNIAEQLGLDEKALEDAKENKIVTIDTNAIQGKDGKQGLTRKLNSFEYLAEKGSTVMNMSLDGSTKQITMPRVGYKKADDGTETYYLNGKQIELTQEETDAGKTVKDVLADRYTAALQDEVQKAFKDKVTVTNEAAGTGKLQLKFQVKNEGSDLIINTDVGDALGIGRTATSYLNTSKTLKDLIGDKLSGLEPVYEKNDDGTDKTNYDGTKIPKLDDKGKQQYDFTLNGVKIGTYTEDTKLSDILSDINSNKEAGVSVSYSQTTQNFTFKAKETGADSQIEMGEGLAQAMFGSTHEPIIGKVSLLSDSEGNVVTGIDENGKEYAIKYRGGKYYKTHTNGNPFDGKMIELDPSDSEVAKLFAQSRKGYTAGQDAVFTATINGEQKTMTRTSNSVSIDGLTINMEETFNTKMKKDADGNDTDEFDLDADGKFQVADAKKSVTFQSKTDSDKVIDAIKSMVADYNTMMSEVKSAYSTMPYQSSSGAFANYEPLTDEDREGMSESAIERYEEKAKQGILFGDRNLNNLYTRMNQAFSFSNTEDVNTLKDMGISVSFNVSDGAQAVTIDEDKLRAMLDSDPDRVANLFTKNDGIMDRMKTQLDYYSKTTGEPKGVLVQQSGTPLSSLSLLSNTWQKEIDNYSSQIEKWQDKLTSQVEKYTSQFSRLEQLIQQMNSQSSTLAGMMGG